MEVTDRIVMPEQELTEVRHPDLVRTAAHRYVDALEEQRGRMSVAGREAADRLLTTIQAALDAGSELRPNDLAFRSRSLDGTSLEDRVRFVNQFILGIGWDAAPILVMGTEASDDYAAANAEELAFHCLYVVLQLSGGSIEILRTISDGSTWATNVKDWDATRRRYDFEPNDLLQLNMGRPRTWRILAEIAATESNWSALFQTGTAAVGLGSLTYQIERSAHPALRAAAGAPPSPTRTKFLETEVIPRLRDSAGTLLLHGFGSGRWPDWWASDERLIKAYLGREEVISFDFRHKVGRQSIEFIEEGDRRVIYSRALNGPVPREYKQLVRRLVHDARAPWPLASE
jgi:hypothetical protein